MEPLLAVGHRKTLDLDDVPDLDNGDSVAGILPSFKANLEALTGDGSGGQKVIVFKLTMALVRTVWWHIAVTALYALIYNLATYVGPYLIDSLVQYLNGDERYASKGKLLVVTFIAAKVFECLSQRHWFFRLQQAGGYVPGLRLSPSCTRNCCYFHDREDFKVFYWCDVCALLPGRSPPPQVGLQRLCCSPAAELLALLPLFSPGHKIFK